MRTLLILLFLSIFPVWVFAQEGNFTPISPLPYTKWKDQQVVEAQNNVVRISNSLLLLKSEKYLPKNTLPEVASESKDEVPTIPAQQEELIVQSEKELQGAIERLDFTKELTIKDYFSVYLSQFRDQPEALTNLASTLSKEEVAKVLSTLLQEQKSESAPAPLPPKKKTAEVDQERAPSKL